MLILSSFEDQKAREILENGHVLALPTETVYGLGIRFDSESAYHQLDLAKGRSPAKPIAVRCGTNFPFDEYFDITPSIRRVRDKFLPGPLTVLVKAKEKAPYQTHLGTYVAGIRIPGKKGLLDFLSTLPFGLQVTSANLSGQPSVKTKEEVEKIFENSPYVDGIIEGECFSGTPTTVVDLTKDEPIVIRQGDITKEEIDKAFFGK